MKRRLTQPAPLLRIAAALAVGIAVGTMAPWPLRTTLLMLCAVVAVAIGARRWSYAQSALVVVGFALLGLARLQMADAKSADEHSNGAAHSGNSPACSNPRTDSGELTGRLRGWFLEQRDSLLGNYRQAASTNDERYAVLAAMTLGDKRALTRELRQAYSITGASHILALSGLHLGIIYAFVSWLMAGRRRYWLSQVVIILSLWAFALLTGLSVSVVRAATMLSVYALFSVSGRGKATVNVLAFTAIVLLLTDARTLFDVGFQMSFASVLSILTFMPVVEAFLPAERLQRHGWLKWAVGMVAVSVAAQLGVAPLIAFYFHRFSTYFLLANFVAIPLATIILYVALAAFLLPQLVPALLWLVHLLNKALAALAQLPLASIEGLHPSVVQIGLIYLAIVCFYLALRRLLR